jgi:hypothetical protein
MAEIVANPKVFISYSWTNEDHLNWVVSLATRLREDGSQGRTTAVPIT